MAAAKDDWRHVPNALTTSGKPWYRMSSMIKLNFFISVVFMGQCLNGYDDGVHEALGYPSTSAIGLLNAAAYIAGLCTAPFAGYIADRWGRRWCVRWSAFCALVGTALGCAAGSGGNGYVLFLISRIVFGSGLAFGLMISPILLQELPHPAQRVTMAGLFNTNYAVGGFLCAWVSFGTSYMAGHWAWRVIYILQIAFGLYLIVAIQFVPESPRWLMSKGREEEAMAFLVKYHGDGNPNDELVLLEFDEMKEALRKEKEVQQNTWREIFGKKANRHRLAIVLLIVSCQNLSGTAIIGNYYTQILDLIGITGTTEQTGINAGLTTWVWVASVIGVCIVNRVKRRHLLMGTWFALILVNIAFTITAAEYQKTGSKAAGIANVVFLIVCGPLFVSVKARLFAEPATEAPCPIQFSYQVECLSYAMRAKGMIVWGIANKIISTSIRSLSVGSATSTSAARFPFCPSEDDVEEANCSPRIVYTCILTVQLCLMYLICVETSGYTLEEIAQVFDGATAPDVSLAPYEAGVHEKKTMGSATATITPADDSGSEKERPKA
ncbi:SPOSA6832_03807 [Sporobolomyces salmonicolor]|uniref:SPOSA6832_03807-mRNA-1:cds n=1 Tax=Sporidiobolus salmonicolor TaxID=5005 RepID=A0A0D6ER20_SPOSA|nr:SPOSA6832_03807 [Sporobolomyces salmonicolor]